MGASAGLNLLCDNYRIDYGSFGVTGDCPEMDSDLVAAVEALCQHRTFFSSKISDMLLRSYIRPSRTEQPESARGRLTARERMSEENSWSRKTVKPSFKQS